MTQLIKNRAILFLVLVISGCGGSLKIHDLPDQENGQTESYLTAQVSFQRNALTREELIPPLRQVWEEEYTSLPNNGFTLVNGWLLFATYNGYLAVVDMKNGIMHGKENLGDASAAPPTIYRGILYQTFESGSSGLIAYDLKNGETIWEVENKFSRSSPVLANNLVFFQTLKGEVASFNYLTGEQIWSRSLPDDIRGSAAFRDNILLVVTQGGSIFALESSSGVTLWESYLGEPVLSNPVIEQNRLYITSYYGKLNIYNFSNGEQIKKIDTGIRLYNSPTVDDNSIYISGSNGQVIAYDKEKLFKKWIFKGEGPVSGAILASDHYLYLGTMAKKMYILDKKDGNALQTINLAGRARSTPVIQFDKLIIACEEKMVVAYAENE